MALRIQHERFEERKTLIRKAILVTIKLIMKITIANDIA
ncbi:MAG: hypothetical protein Ct9H90mP6_01550 [Gammaproteobacteria bacterium]|nr:MAG: hypothetical protein Ct9H90mP6_01550 [Gammaproteobacteria bacterium]